MKYLSEILKIIEHGTNGNTEAVKNYGNLLSEKMAQDGLLKESELVAQKSNKIDNGEYAYPLEE